MVYNASQFVFFNFVCENLFVSSQRICFLEPCDLVPLIAIPLAS